MYQFLSFLTSSDIFFNKIDFSIEEVGNCSLIVGISPIADPVPNLNIIYYTAIPVAIVLLILLGMPDSMRMRRINRKIFYFYFLFYFYFSFSFSFFFIILNTVICFVLLIL
jgi:hypothetical protein